MSTWIFLFLNFSIYAEPLPPVVIFSDGSEEGKSLDQESALGLEDSSQKELFEVLTTAPNLNFTSGSNQPRFFQVRGVGETSQFERSQVNSFGLFYEGIDLSEEASTLPRFGFEFLEVDFGPQSSKWGSKALAGSLEVSSCLAKDCSQQIWQVTGGNFETFSLKGGSSLKFKKASYFFGLNVEESEGFYENTYLDRPTNARNERQLVLGSQHKLGKVQFRQHHIFSKNKNGYDVWGAEPSFRTITDNPGKDHHLVHGHSFNYQTLHSNLRVKGLTSITFAQQEEAYDEDWGNNVHWRNLPGWNDNYNYYSHFERERFKFHQKLSLVSPQNVEVGLHYYRYLESQTIQSFKNDALRSSSTPEFSSSNLGLWVEQQNQFHNWSNLLSARVENQNLQLSGADSSQAQDVPWLTAMNLDLKRQWNDFWSNTLTLSKGFRGGGFNIDHDLSAERRYFGPESIYMAQLATENRGEEHFLMFRFFHQWQIDQQLRSSLQTDPQDPNSYIYFTENKGFSKSLGLEAVLERAFGNWDLSSSLGILKSRLYSRENSRSLAQAPEWTYSLKLVRRFQKLKSFVEWTGRDSFYYSNDHDFKSKAYGLVNMGLSYQVKTWTVSLWGKNILDKRYAVRAFYFANEPPDWEEKLYTQLGNPRTFGLSGKWEY